MMKKLNIEYIRNKRLINIAFICKFYLWAAYMGRDYAIISYPDFDEFLIKIHAQTKMETLKNDEHGKFTKCCRLELIDII
jgi:hypothetical protein